MFQMGLHYSNHRYSTDIFYVKDLSLSLDM